MKKLSLLLVLFLCLASCEAQNKVAPKIFSEKVLADTFVDIDGSNIIFSDILEKYKGKQIVVDIWASWCKDCIKSLPKVKALKANNQETVFLFLSLDKNIGAWKKGIEKHHIKGEHYFLKSGWKGDFATFIDLDWIPRYLIVDKNGNITLFRAIKADDDALLNTLKK